MQNFTPKMRDGQDNARKNCQNAAQTLPKSATRKPRRTEPNFLDALHMCGKSLVVPEVLMDFFSGDHTKTHILNNLVFWTNKTGGKSYFYKSHRELGEEVKLSAEQVRYHVRKIVEMINKLEPNSILTFKKKVRGAPTMHYRIDIEKLEKALCKKLRKLKKPLKRAKNQLKIAAKKAAPKTAKSDAVANAKIATKNLAKHSEKPQKTPSEGSVHRKRENSRMETGNFPKPSFTVTNDSYKELSTQQNLSDQKPPQPVEDLAVEKPIEKQIEKKNDPVLFTLPLRQDQQFNVTQSLIDEFKADFPQVDLLHEFKRMKAWLLSCARRLKPANIMRLFVFDWFAKSDAKRKADAAKQANRQQQQQHSRAYNPNTTHAPAFIEPKREKTPMEKLKEEIANLQSQISGCENQLERLKKWNIPEDDKGFISFTKQLARDTQTLKGLVQQRDGMQGQVMA